MRECVAISKNNYYCTKKKKTSKSNTTSYGKKLFKTQKKQKHILHKL